MEHGLTECLRVDFDWMDREVAPGPKRATFAALRIEARGGVATEVEETLGRTVRPTIRVPAYAFARWLTANW